MAYQSLYLKYRPQTFDEIIGQDHICRTLRNALSAGKPAHAYLFCGPRGTGKTTTARILAKALSCEKGVTPDPCTTCDACQAIRDGSLLDVVEIDAASNTGVDNIRELKEVIGYAPSWGRFRIYIIDEVHMLSTAAWNALLKTLEEPPDHAYFIMATTDPQKVLPTILSRCQRFDFRRVAQPQLVEHLTRIAERESIAVDEAALWAVARLSDGCVRDSITMFDQIRAYAEGQVTIDAVHAVLGTLDDEVFFRIMDQVAAADAAAVFHLVDGLAHEGKDFAQVIHGLTGHCRNLLLVKSGCTSASALEASEDTVARLRRQAEGYTMDRLVDCLRELSDARENLKWSHQHRLLLEMSLVGMMAPARAPSSEAAPLAQWPEPPPPAVPAQPACGLDDDPPVLMPPPARAAAPARATDHWQKVVLRVAESMPRLGGILASSVAERVGEDELLITFGSKFGCDSFSERLRNEEFGPSIRAAIKDVYGLNMRISCQHVPQENGETAPSAPAPSADALVLDIFGGGVELTEGD
ncbi:MAG TPA: DNA polymerase III subunit gamma/tau [Armatimonadota bacterium]|nr:DNA polymerase III subunit gamma/tau [Armatimonadota bacterium]